MQTKEYIDFEFKKKEKLKFEINTTDTVDFVAMETLQNQIVSIVFYCLMIIFFNKGLLTGDVFPLFLFIAKLSFVGNAISQAFKYLKEKNIKNQLVNGTINMGLFIYLFISSGFNDFLNITYQGLKLFFNI